MSEKPGYRKLNHYKEKGFVFHGSIRQGLKVLLPQEPHDAGDDPWNKDEAVYATIEPALAIPFSLRKGYTGVLTVAMEPDKVMATFATFSDLLCGGRKPYGLSMSGCTARLIVFPVSKHRRTGGVWASYIQEGKPKSDIP